MKKILLLMVLALIPAAHAATIADWPHMFVVDGTFSAAYVIGTEASSLDVVSATRITSSLQRYENVTTEVGTTKLDNEVADITAINAIVVGSPCENTAAAALMGNPQPCDKDLQSGKGHIKLYENNGKHQLLITGLTDKDREQAAFVLESQDLTSVHAMEHLVDSFTGSQETTEVKPEETKNKTETNVTATPEVIPEPQPIELVEPVEVEPEPTIEEEPEGFFAVFWEWFKSLFS